MSEMQTTIIKDCRKRIAELEKALIKIANLDRGQGLCSHASGCDSPAIATKALKGE